MLEAAYLVVRYPPLKLWVSALPLYEMSLQTQPRQSGLNQGRSSLDWIRVNTVCGVAQVGQLWSGTATGPRSSLEAWLPGSERLHRSPSCAQQIPWRRDTPSSQRSRNRRRGYWLADRTRVEAAGDSSRPDTGPPVSGLIQTTDRGSKSPATRGASVERRNRMYLRAARTLSAGDPRWTPTR